MICHLSVVYTHVGTLIQVEVNLISTFGYLGASILLGSNMHCVVGIFEEGIKILFCLKNKWPSMRFERNPQLSAPPSSA